jgi:hypothetical protein
VEKKLEEQRDDEQLGGAPGSEQGCHEVGVAMMMAEEHAFDLLSTLATEPGATHGRGWGKLSHGEPTASTVTNREAAVAKVLCVLYDDPVDG